MKKIIILGSALLLIPVISLASIDTNLYYGLRNNQEVKELQEFLIEKGMLNSLPTGNFLSLTLKAVKSYQATNRIPATGYVGILTRTAINSELADTLLKANQQSIAETGGPIPPPIPQKTTNDVVSGLQSQIDVLQQQLQATQNQQNTLNQIYQNTQQIAQNTAQFSLPTINIKTKIEAIGVTLSKATLRVGIIPNSDGYPQKNSDCYLVIKDQSNKTLRNSDVWGDGVGGIISQTVSDIDPKNTYSYSLTCRRANYQDFFQTETFPSFTWLPLIVDCQKTTDGYGKPQYLAYVSGGDGNWQYIWNGHDGNWGQNNWGYTTDEINVQLTVKSGDGQIVSKACPN